MREDPVLIMGAPRSGTSVTAAIMARCGLWLGDTGRGSMDNPSGFFENKKIREINKSVLRGGDYDPAGVDPLPAWNWLGNSQLLRSQVLEELERQGAGEQRWGFKDPKLLLTWATWITAFPKARILMVRRDHISIVRSCQRASFFRRRKVDWDAWVTDQARRIILIETAAQELAATVWPGKLKLADGRNDFKRAAESVGLTWKPGAEEFFAGGLWNR